MMNTYSKPTLEIYALEQTDVIRTSGESGGSTGDGSSTNTPSSTGNWTKFY